MLIALMRMKLYSVANMSIAIPYSFPLYFFSSISLLENFSLINSLVFCTLLLMMVCFFYLAFTNAASTTSQIFVGFYQKNFFCVINYFAFNSPFTGQVCSSILCIFCVLCTLSFMYGMLQRNVLSTSHIIILLILLTNFFFYLF